MRLVLLRLLFLGLGLLAGLSNISRAGDDDENGLSQIEVERTIQRNIPKLKRCFTLNTRSAGSGDGSILIQFKVNMRGRVTHPEIDSNESLQPLFHKCIRESVSEWIFPLPRGGIDVDVSYPLLSRMRPNSGA